MVLYIVAGWITQALAPQKTAFHAVRFNLLTVAGLVVYILVRGLFAYGVRQSLLWVKILVVLGFIVSCYTNTYWRVGIVAGVGFGHFSLDSLGMLLQNLFTLAALVVMSWKPRRTSPSVDLTATVIT